MQSFVTMRDRRNTSLSISSISSTYSTPSGPSRNSLNERRHFSPPPLSPTLPAPVTKENRSKSNVLLRLSIAFQLLVIVGGMLVLWHLLTVHSARILGTPSLGNGSHAVNVQPVGGDMPSDEPTAFLVSDQNGNSRWTVWIPRNHSVPLPSRYYADICEKSEALRNSISVESRVFRAKNWRRRDAYYTVDQTFLDIDAAESIGILPKTEQSENANTCEKSLTFSLDTEDASFGKSLLLLWMSYGLARKEGRAFFVDDVGWPYGRYAWYFPPPPPPGCAPPPPHHVVSCPHSAKHILVSAATAPWTFGPSFERHFSHPRKTGVGRTQPVYELLRRGYEDLFGLIDEDALYATSRIAKVKDEARENAGYSVGVHIRRGDRHPHEFQFKGDYLPLERYVSAGKELLRSQLSASLPEMYQDDDDSGHFPLLLASDDPDILNSAELSEAAWPFVVQRAQDRIQLATKAALDQTSPTEPLREPGSAYVKHVEENSGWDGGFYRSLFFSLGMPKSRPGAIGLETLHQSPGRGTGGADDGDTQLPAQAARLRELVGRAYLLDLAVLGENDAVVCAVSSASCRVLGVMLGWDAVRLGRWKNVDDGRVWSWDGGR